MKAVATAVQTKSRDRRQRQRRREKEIVGEAIQRKVPERREEERRDSVRVARRIWVMDPQEGGTFKVFPGEVSLGGASWKTPWPPLSKELDVRCRLPGFEDEWKASALVKQIDGEEGDLRVRVVFTNLTLRSELALARYLDSCAAER